MPPLLEGSPLPLSSATAPVADARPVQDSAARVVLLLSSLGFFLITLDILIVNVALPSIGRELGGGTAAQQWVIDGYTLMFAALLLFAGNLSDRIGAKTALGARDRRVPAGVDRLRAGTDHGCADRGPVRAGRGGGDHAARDDGADP